MILGNLALLLSVGLSAPIDLLPCKNSIEELIFKNKTMTTCQNFFVTLIMISISTSLALFVETIGDAMTLVGCIFTPVVGFFLPILFYLPQISHEPWYSLDKVTCFLSASIILVASILSLVEFFSNYDDPC